MKKGKLSALIATILVGMLLLGGCQVKYTQEELDLQLTDAVGDAVKTEQDKSAVAINSAIDTLKTEKDGDIADLQKSIDDLKTITETLGTEKDTLATEKSELEKKLAVVTEEKAKEEEINKGYLIDGLQLGAIDVSEVISDRDVEKLFDGEIKFDGEEYDAEETFSLIDLTIAINKEDFNGKAYLEIPAESVKYTYSLANDLDTSDIEEDETLKFKFLGGEVEVSDWDTDKITFTRGTKETFKEGETKPFEDKTITVRVIGKDGVSVKVADEDGSQTTIINTGEQGDVYGLEIYVEELLYSDGNSEVTLKYGSDVKNTVKDGEPYEKDSIWEYAITSKSLSLVLSEEYLGRDTDDDYMALAPGEKLSLPNDYITIEYNGVSEEDVEKYDFDLGTGSKSGYVKAKGNFLSGIEDYTKIYIDSSGIYDSDLDLISNTEIELGDTGLSLTLDTTTYLQTWLVINNLWIREGLDSIFADGNPISSEDEDYLTTYGITIDNPEDSVEDEKADISIPEEELEASLTVY